MRLPLAYQLSDLDGSAGERGALLQDIRDRGILEAADLTAFCFKVEALLERHAERELELFSELVDARRVPMPFTSFEEIRETVEIVFDDLRELLPKRADLLYVKCNEILGRLKE